MFPLSSKTSIKVNICKLEYLLISCTSVRWSDQSKSGNVKLEILTKHFIKAQQWFLRPKSWTWSLRKILIGMSGEDR